VIRKTGVVSHSHKRRAGPEIPIKKKPLTENEREEKKEVIKKNTTHTEYPRNREKGWKKTPKERQKSTAATDKGGGGKAVAGGNAEETLLPEGVGKAEKNLNRVVPRSARIS